MTSMRYARKLRRGDKVAIVSLSSGMLGEDFCSHNIEIGVKRLGEYGLEPVFMPNTLKGIDYLNEHPEARADDLMWALKNNTVNGIICMMGGDDSYRVFPYIDLDVIKKNPKVFMGYSDIASWMAVFAKAGVRAYYGPNLLTPIAQPIKLDEYTQTAITKTIFSTNIIGEVTPCAEVTNIEWRNFC